MPLTPAYLHDTQVDGALDAELRGLLTRCFGERFENKRYEYEMPPHRWLVRDGGVLVAHTAAHEKVVKSGGTALAFLGIAEVCVAPSHRGRGLVRAMMGELEKHFAGFPFAVLLGDPGVYGSSGYRPVGNVYFPFEETGEPNTGVMVKALGSQAWPTSKVTIEGPPF